MQLLKAIKNNRLQMRTIKVQTFGLNIGAQLLAKIRKYKFKFSILFLIIAHLMNIQSVAVFCGSKKGNNPLFAKHASELGRLIAMLRLQLVYGGGSKGLMGIVANAVLEYEGKVLGIIPEVLVGWESQHSGLTELVVVPDMHSRKKM